MEENKNFLVAREAAKLLKINEKKIYVLAQEGKIPATKITGKWLFPKTELETHLRQKAASSVISKDNSLNKIILMAGSDDPVISSLNAMFHDAYPQYSVFYSISGSMEGLNLLKKGFCQISLSHLHEPDSNDFNFSEIKKIFSGADDLIVLNLFSRNVGFISKNKTVKSFKQIKDDKLRFVNRQCGSGIRKWVDEQLVTERIKPALICGYQREVYTHLGVAAMIMSGDADAGVAAESAASISGLNFYKLFCERFDMIMKKETFFERHVQAFVEFIRSGILETLTNNLNGYDTALAGKIIFKSA